MEPVTIQAALEQHGKAISGTQSQLDGLTAKLDVYAQQQLVHLAS